MTISTIKKQYLKSMDIDVWLRRETLHSVAEAEVHTTLEMPDWQVLQDTVRHCEHCGLCGSRTNTVFGVGDPGARVMIIGEAPGFHEDQQGQPFVGRAGQLLNAILASVGLLREAVFITNILKCRPPNNRDPSPEEVASCTPYLKQQIAIIQPQAIIAVGRIAAQHLLNCKTALGQLRGRSHDYDGVPLWVTYHPAYLLRNPIDKRKAYQDWLQIKKNLT